MLSIGTLHLPSLVLSVFSWSSFYMALRHLEPQRKPEWHCRLVTVVHASLITLMAGWATFVQGPWPFTDAGGPSTGLQVTVTTVCLGYFLFDFAWCLYFQTEGFPMLLHHSLSIFGMFFMLCAGKYGSEMAATIFGSEVTNPLLQLRWFLKDTGRYNTVLGEVVDILFMTSFFFVRLGVGSVLLYSYFQQPTDFWGQLAAVTIYLIGWMFFVSIFQYAVYKYKKKHRAYQASSLAFSQNKSAASPRKEKPNAYKEDLTKTSVFSSETRQGAKHYGGQSVLVGECQNGVHYRNNGGTVQSVDKGATKKALSDKLPSMNVLANGNNGL